MIYFVSGHCDITEEEFKEHYEPKLWQAICDDSEFIVGDCPGVDTMAQKYLKALQCKKITVYHMYDYPRYNAGCVLKGGYTRSVDIDTDMTMNSDKDIAWVRCGKEKSDTQKNIDRRKNYLKGI